MISYRVTLTPDSNDTLLVQSPDFPELVTFGDDEADALSYAVGAFQEAIAARMAYKKEIPSPSMVEPGDKSVELPLHTGLKVLLYQQMWRKGPGQPLSLQILRDSAINVFEVHSGDRYEFYK